MLSSILQFFALVRTLLGRALSERLSHLQPNLISLTDDELVAEAVKRGSSDDRPFRELWHRHQRMVWRTCYSFMRNGADAEDLVQEVFVKAYRGLGSFEGRAAFKTWINRIAINTAKNELRRRSRRPQEAETPIEEMSEWFPGPATQSVEAQVSMQGQAEQLTEAMRLLRPEEFEVLYLREVEERGYQEIADLLNIGLSAAKMRVQRARLALQRAYKLGQGEEATV